MEHSLLPLCFATFFQCAVKPYSGFSQKKCFYILVYGEADPSVVTYQPTLISAFNKGTKPLPEHIRNLLSSLPQESLNDRIRALSIQDPVSCADSLERLISISTLSAESKENLLAQYDGSEPHTFVTLVFQNALCSSASLRDIPEKARNSLFEYCINATPLSNELPDSASTHSPDPDSKESLMDANKTKRTTDKSRKKISYLSEDNSDDDSSNLSRPVLGNYKADADGRNFNEWLAHFNLPLDTNNPAEPSATWVKRYIIKLPQDIMLLMHFAYMISADSAFMSLETSDLFSAAHLDRKKWCIQDGHIELYEINGAPNDVASLIESLPSANASHVLLWCQLNQSQTLDDFHSLIEAANALSPDADLIFGSKFYNDRNETTAFLLLYMPDDIEADSSTAKAGTEHTLDLETDTIFTLLNQCGLGEKKQKTVQDDAGPEIMSFLKPREPKNH